MSAATAVRPPADVDTTPAADVAAPPARNGEIVVTLVRGARSVSAHSLQAARAQATGPARRRVQVLAVPRGFEETAADIVARDSRVVSAAPNFVRAAASHDTDETGWGVELLRAPDLWHGPSGVDGSGVRVAVVDSGVDARHAQLAGRVAAGYDAYGTNGRDNCGHGTAVAGVVAARLDGASTAGVAPEATIVPVKVLEYDDFFQACTGDDANIARGVLWAADPEGGRADIINLSLSGPQISDVLRDAITTVTRRGVIVIGAAGNRADRTPMYPAAYPEVISVGGVERDGASARWWSQSNFGTIDVVAPAKDVPLLLAARVPMQRIGRPCRIGDATGMCSDGTSFAAPHVAGMAALLHEKHPELATLTGQERVARVRQWLLGTARDVAPTRSRVGVDLETGHGLPDAAAAGAASTDPATRLLTWEGGSRVLSPWSRLRVAPTALPLTAVVTDGTGAPVKDAEATFEGGVGAQLDASAGKTDATGAVSTTLRSTAQGRRTAVSVRVGERSLRVQAYVLDRDDNIPGIKAPALSFRDKLRVDVDPDDVFRYALRAGETLRARVRSIDLSRESLDMYLHHAGTTNVSDPEFAPLREDTAAFAADPLRVKVTVPTDGVRFLDLYGYGTYRLKWRILSPGKVRHAEAAPAEFTPDGDGRQDVTRIRWRQTRPGNVTVRFVDRDGRRVHTAVLGRRARGDKVYRWDGRSDGGLLQPTGSYRVEVRWANGRGRIWKSTTRVRLVR